MTVSLNWFKAQLAIKQKCLTWFPHCPTETTGSFFTCKRKENKWMNIQWQNQAKFYFKIAINHLELQSTASCSSLWFCDDKHHFFHGGRHFEIWRKYERLRNKPRYGYLKKASRDSCPFSPSWLPWAIF